jgi:UDP-3-O-[3-hydroxymyristoyl] glucosamine N-acyltransferase
VGEVSTHELTMDTVTLSELAGRYGVQLRGSDRPIRTIGSVDSDFTAPALSFALNARWASAPGAGVEALIVSESLADELDTDRLGLLVTSRNPQEVFYEVFYDSAVEHRWHRVPGNIHPDAHVHPRAFVSEHVHIGAGSVIMPGAVLLDNTVLGEQVTVKPNAVLGGDGFQVRQIRGRPVVVPHVGGVLVGDRASIGSQTCLDRGLFGENTTVGPRTQVDNLVHIAHSVVIDADAVIVACAEISGSVRVGRGAWIGPNASINQGLAIGDHAFIGTGGSVVRSLPAYAMAYGNPAKQRGWVCACRSKLTLSS